MQYVRNISEQVSTAWNSINPATLSGAIDVIVVEQDNGTLACSPFHVRFGKFSLLRPYEKKVEFKVNGVKQGYAMKLGEGGEAFFVFETTETIPQSLQTSPLVSPVNSPPLQPESASTSDLQEPDLLQLDGGEFGKPRSATLSSRPGPTPISRPGLLTPLSTSADLSQGRPTRGWPGAQKVSHHSDDVLPLSARTRREDSSDGSHRDDSTRSHRSISPPPLAYQRAMTLSKELSAVNIPTHVTETGDLMLDMTGFKSSEEEAINAEILARNILSAELQGDYDVGALFGMDEGGNLWIYSSEDAKEAAMQRTMASLNQPGPVVSIDAASDPGYASDDSSTSAPLLSHRRTESDAGHMSIGTPPTTPGSSSAGDPNRNYAKTLRLTSDQLKKLNLRLGENTMAFTVNRATCMSNMYLWKHDTPVVISDIDGTITKSDTMGHIMPRIGRDWTHAGVAKLYSDISANGYNIMYLTSRSVGLADSTRAYLNSVHQEGYRLPHGPTILSPDRTFSALRREVIIKKPEVFKMATLRDIRNLYGLESHCFYAGFGNRLTDQISYRTVDVPRSRIFTINWNSEVSLDLLSLNRLKLSYVNMNEVVDHYFPPVSTLVKGGGEQYTDFAYWRDQPLDIDQFSASEEDDDADGESDAEEEEEDVGNMGDSYLSRGDDDLEGSILSGSGIYEEDRIMGSMIEDEDADDEDDEELGEKEEVFDNKQQLHVPRHDGGVAKASSPSPKVAVQDINAELITGMQNLGIEKEVKDSSSS